MELTETPVPAMEFWEIQYSTSMAVFVPGFYSCISKQPDVQLLTTEVASIMDQNPADQFFLYWGDVNQVAGYATVLGYDHWVVIVNPANPVDVVTLDELSSLFKGNKTSWNEISSFGAASSFPLEVWVYMDDIDIGLEFKETVDSTENRSAMLAPNPGAMMEAVAENEGAIGFVPESWLDDSVKRIQIQGLSDWSREVPVVVLSPEEPAGRFREWLFCLQDFIP